MYSGRTILKGLLALVTAALTLLGVHATPFELAPALHVFILRLLMQSCERVMQ